MRYFLLVNDGMFSRSTTLPWRRRADVVGCGRFDFIDVFKCLLFDFFDLEIDRGGGLVLVALRGDDGVGGELGG
jgi:hypothetical protein